MFILPECNILWCVSLIVFFSGRNPWSVRSPVWNFSIFDFLRSVDLISQKGSVYCHWNEYISNMDSGIPGFARWHAVAAVLFFFGGGSWSMMTRDDVFPCICKPHQNPPKWTHDKQTWSVGGVFYCSMLMFLILTEELQDLDTTINSMGSIQHSWVLSGVMRYDAIPNNAPRANHSKLSIGVHCVLFPHYPIAFMYGNYIIYIYNIEINHSCR